MLGNFKYTIKYWDWCWHLYCTSKTLH